MSNAYFEVHSASFQRSEADAHTPQQTTIMLGTIEAQARTKQESQSTTEKQTIKRVKKEESGKTKIKQRNTSI
jgi:hypothetical protein